MKLESLLHYFHVVCKPAVADMDEKIRVSLLSNIDIVATGAVLACTDLRRKLTWCLLDNTLKFYKQIKAHLDKVKMAPPMGFLRGAEVNAALEWIDFNAHEIESEAEKKKPCLKKTTTDAPKLQPKVLTFDEATGQAKNAQDTRVVAATRETTWHEVPWKEWLTWDASRTLADGGSVPWLEASVESVVKVVMRTIHQQWDFASMPIKIMGTLTKGVRVITTANIPKGELVIPPCVPRSMKVYQTTDHPNRVKIQVIRNSLKAAVADASERDGDADTMELFLVPEFKAPDDVTTPEEEISAPGTRVWEWDGKETMHPYWAIKREATTVLNTRSANLTTDQPPFMMCGTTNRSFTVCSCGVAPVTDSTLTDTYTVVVPMLTNVADAVPDMELVINHDKQAAKKKDRSYMWKDDLKSGAGAHKNKSKAEPEKKKRKKGDTDEV